MKWVANKNVSYKKKSTRATDEEFIICIPMLREQRVVSETLKYFSQLNYPKDKYHIVVVTTNKEIAEKTRMSRFLSELAGDVSQGKALKTIQDRYSGLFPFDQLRRVYEKYRLESYTVVFKKVKSIYKQLPTTFNLAIKEAEIINAHFKSKLITVMNYPRSQGVMSHQINYVIKKLAKYKQSTNSIFAVYNADSRPNPNTLRNVAYALKEFEEETGIKPNIVQQSSLFTLNYSKYSKTFTGYSLKAAALFQTKWTLVRELTRFRSQSRSVITYKDNFISKLFNTKISHCVGHGLFVRFGILKNEYLPTETINEDLPFGFYQCCKGEPILPLPILENSETPDTLKGLMNQKRFWFTPYLQYQYCRDRVLQLKKYRSRLEVEILTIQAELTGFIWFLQSFVLFMPLIIGLYLHSLSMIALWSIGLLIYWFVPIGLIYTNLNKLEDIAGKSVSKTDFKDYILTSFFGLYILLTHSIGPILCVRDFALAKFIDKPITKLKTER
ncbi:MAG: hypothetical protein UT24_C0004G0042 [Candidatus Woesebacteria bacterium GW2011_GWB1_39_12]|uniref:Glycosyltransferase 2-like domain-containing protein n=2 Tax=Candidatus Woeseibacteriota TaxID=1752722 RepID=A0A0G0PJZ7_9BACT|nr:MAG: hypothetical protein UT23_C0003G0046 [Candidatus Woesebacteria bacterium GW2011_GWA1_39_12]KKR01479.1 MAG: hypothetical protein UT24_C0004G0042 [Candidatus Woesebacteria bacterium GW2011_GWB1_39_12]